VPDDDRRATTTTTTKTIGQDDPTVPQAQMHAPPAAAPEPVRLIFPDLLAAATDSTLKWERLRDGIDIARLYAGGTDGPSAALLRYAPGARLARHEHTGYEHIFILAGSQVDDGGEHHAGALLIHGPATSHAIASKHGCLVLAIWERPVRFIG
jgi:anti-sigma factor ChrR (cupin superfamily)